VHAGGSTPIVDERRRIAVPELRYTIEHTTRWSRHQRRVPFRLFGIEAEVKTLTISITG